MLILGCLKMEMHDSWRVKITNMDVLPYHGMLHRKGQQGHRIGALGLRSLGQRKDAPSSDESKNITGFVP